MKTFPLILLCLLGFGSMAAAQESLNVDPSPRVFERDEELGIDRGSAPEPLEMLLPRSLRDPLVDPASDLPTPSVAELLGWAEPETLPFSLGASGGYLRAKDADRGTWFGGVQARLRMGIFAAEASIQFHQNRYDDGAVVVTQYPVQLTAFLYVIPVGPIRPYILGGVGWYYTRIDYEHGLSSLPTGHQNIFGEHLGAGAELFLGPSTSIDADVRYIFLNPTTNQVIGREFNYWQLTAGVNFFF